MATPIPDNRARFTIDELVAATRGRLTASTRAPTVELAGVTSDSRKAVAGTVFVALRGESHDGHAFVAAAAKRGAAVAVVERGRAGDAAGLAVVEVDDTLVALGDIARAHIERWRTASPDRRVVAITGSAGKTTTKELTAALLGAIAPTHFTAGNLNNRIGVPSVVLALREEHRFAVLEMGMSLPGELDAITSFARPDVAIVTNVGVAHAEGVGGREGVMKEKGAVYRALSDDGVAVVNADDEWASRAAEGTRARRIVTFGRSAGAHHRLAERVAHEAGSRVTIARPGGAVTVRLPIPGEAAAIDLAAAVAAQEAASGVELDAERIDRALASVDLAGRAKIRVLDRDVLVLDDTYNANPASMRAALATLAEIAGSRRKVAVLGEMKELGPLGAEEHDALGDAVAEAGIDVVVGCGGLATRAVDRARARGVGEAVAAADTAEAAREAAARVRPGDAVLVKGSRGVGAEAVVEALVSWPNPRFSASSRTS